MTENDAESEQDDKPRDCWILQRKTLDTRPREAGVYLNKGEAIQTAEEIKAESHDRTLVFITKSELHS